MTNAADLLEQAQEDGLLIESRGQKVHVAGPAPVIDRWRPLLKEHKAELLEILGSRCDRCGALGVRLIPSYYGPRFCSPCCTILSDQHDRASSWPPMPAGVVPAGWG